MSVATFETAPSPPEVSVSAVRTDEFTISWSEVANASLIEIAVVPAPELSGDGVFKLNSADRQFTLERLDAETVYHVTLKALIQSVIVTDSIQLNQLTAPLPPVVYATEIRSSSMEIQWTTIPEAAHYVLDVYPRPESLPGSAEEYFELLENSILLTELRAETRYEITVWAVLISGSTTNEAVVSQTTAPLPPKIILKEARTTRAALIFTPIRSTIEYKITVDPPVAGISDFSRTSTKLDLLQTRPDVEYTVTIIAQLEGKATDSRALTFTSAPPPVVASGKDKRSTSIRINWDPVPEAHRYYAEITPPTNSGISRIPIYTNFVQLSDLKEDTFYNMTITAVSARSTWTTDDHICEFSTAPKMSKLTTSDVTSHAMMLSWFEVYKIEMYRLEFSPSIGASKYETAFDLFVDNMEPDTEYEIAIIGIGDDFETDPYRLKRFTAPPAPVINFPSIKSRRLDLEWNSLPDDYYWIVNIYPVPAGHEDTWPLKTEETTFTALGLEPESEYSFTIRAVSEQRALVTDLTTIGQKTAPLGPPIKVPNHTVRTTSAVVEWEEIPTAISYKVFAKSLHSDSYDVHYTTSAISHVLQDLQALAEYEVSVLALLVGNGVTDVTITTFMTAPEPPSFEVVRARVKKDSTVHVNSTWSSITDDDEYFINMSPPTGSFRSQLVTKSNEQFHITGLALGRPYRFGIFAKLPDGKRTDVRSVVYQTPSSPRCYECSSVSDPKDCIAEVACPLNSGYSCMTFDRRENGRRMLTRGCKKRDACETQRKSHKCSSKHRHSCVLVGCCNDDLCNEGNRLN
ncbi:unnamed protein product [Oikopleura dioica]|uniref:Fibronectin type-III domain-containing protein n=1 Tax=Oikopleura dioica TaxID=34765 RepID=E4Y768_OIKDI|nr:unnamed protein product [Oikopleura dioica]